MAIVRDPQAMGRVWTDQRGEWVVQEPVQGVRDRQRPVNLIRADGQNGWHRLRHLDMFEDHRLEEAYDQLQQRVVVIERNDVTEEYRCFFPVEVK